MKEANETEVKKSVELNEEQKGTSKELSTSVVEKVEELESQEIEASATKTEEAETLKPKDETKTEEPVSKVDKPLSAETEPEKIVEDTKAEKEEAKPVEDATTEVKEAEAVKPADETKTEVPISKVDEPLSVETEPQEVVEETKAEKEEAKPVEEATTEVKEAEVAKPEDETKTEEPVSKVDEPVSVETEPEKVVEETKDEKEEAKPVEEATTEVKEAKTVKTADETKTEEPVSKVDEPLSVETEAEKVIEETKVEKEEAKRVEEETTEVKEAEKSEIEEESKPEEKEEIDYSTFERKELVVLLSDIIENKPIQDIRTDVDTIKANFYKKNKAEYDEKRAAFIEGGGDPEAFEYEADDTEDSFKALLNKYKSLRAEYNKNIELEKAANLKKKYEVIDEIKSLINGKESINKTFEDFHALQNKWHEIGLVPQSEIKNMWETYHYNVEKFYDFIKINRELRDLDLRKNLEAKLKLCEKADELIVEPSVIKAFNSLQKLHEQWREIGPVPNDKREEIWERFKDSTSKINKAHQDYFEKLKESQINNLKAKTVLCEKAEEIAALDLVKHKDWEEKSNEIIDLQKLWKAIGFATKRENNVIFERFRSACDKFFVKKREFYNHYKEEQSHNLQMKTQLCIAAEAIKDSNDWKSTTEELIRLQKQWKEIGAVHRKQSDAIWKRFRAACNEFFDRKEKHFANIDQEYNDNLAKKEELIDKVKNLKINGDVNESLNQLNEIQKEWTLIGHVPYKQKDKVQKEFRTAINAQFDNLNIDKVKRSVFVYKQKIDNYSDKKKGNRHIKFEKDKILETIRQLENDINILENNIGFFAKTKGAESLIKDVNQKIEDAKTKIKIEKQKLDILVKRS